MPIGSYLEGDVFEPELIETMSLALADTCKALGLKLQHDTTVRLLAVRIINKARQGIHDRELLKAAALDGLGSPRRH